MGSGTDYSPQISRGLDQANTPKSGLAQQYSGLLGGVAPGILHSLMNTQNLGNSFLNVNGAGSNNGNNSPYVQNFLPPTNGGGGGFGTIPQFNPNNGNQPTNAPIPTQGSLNYPAPMVGGNGAGSNNNSSYNSGPMLTANNGAQYQGSPYYQPDPTKPNYQPNNALPWAPEGWTGPQNNANGPGSPSFNPASNYNLDGGGGGMMDGNGTSVMSPMDMNMGDTNPIINPIFGVPTPGGGNQGGGNGGTQWWNNFNQLNPNAPYQPSQNEQNAFNQGQGFGNPGQGQQGGINVNGFQGAAPTLQGMDQSGMNPQALMTLLQQNIAPGTNYANNQNTNTNPQIQQLLQMIGGQPSQVNAGFNPQNINPNAIQNPGFQAQGADLSGINTGTQLTGGSQDSYNAIANILQNQQKQAMADQHERFTGIGGARGTGASLADAQLQAQMQPQLAQALNSVRNNEVSNQLQSAGLQSSNALANSGMMNQYGLGGAQLDVQRQGQNVSNSLNAAGINNQYGLGSATLNSQNQQANQNAGLQNQGMNNNLLAQLLGQQGTNSNNSNNYSLGQNQLNSQNLLATLGLNQQGAMGALNAQNQNQQTNNNSNLGMNQILSQLAQANSSGANAFNLGVAGMNQSAAQQQIQNQMQSLMSIFGMGSGMANAGIPGGSANVNVGNGNNGNNFGSNMAGLASILSMFGG